MEVEASDTVSSGKWQEWLCKHHYMHKTTRHISTCQLASIPVGKTTSSSAINIHSEMEVEASNTVSSGKQQEQPYKHHYMHKTARHIYTCQLAPILVGKATSSSAINIQSEMEVEASNTVSSGKQQEDPYKHHYMHKPTCHISTCQLAPIPVGETTSSSAINPVFRPVLPTVLEAMLQAGGESAFLRFINMPNRNEYQFNKFLFLVAQLPIQYQNSLVFYYLMSSWRRQLHSQKKFVFQQHGSPNSIFLHTLLIDIQNQVMRVRTKSGLREFFEVSGSKKQVYACWKSYCPCHNFLQKMKQRPLLYVSQSAAHTRVVGLNRGKCNRVHFFLF